MIFQELKDFKIKEYLLAVLKVLYIRLVVKHYQN
jgi:hypothetical protein